MHYSDAQSMGELQAWAVGAAESFTSFPAGYIPLLVYAGMSGTSHATALAMELYRSDPKFKFNMVYVRKAGEKSHGELIEDNIAYSKSDDTVKFLAVFVDDFVDSGSTFKRCMRKVLSLPFNIVLHVNNVVPYRVNGSGITGDLLDYAITLSDKKER